MKKLVAILPFLFFYSFVFSQVSEPVLLSLHGIGGSGGDNVAPQVTKTTDGGFIIGISSNSDTGTGSIDSFCTIGGNRSIFIKYNADASVQEWSKCYLGNGDTGLAFMFPQNDGSIVFGGEYLSGGFYICKQNSLGNIVWGHGYSQETGPLLRDMIATDDGGYMILGIAYNTDTNFTIHGSGFEYADIGVIKLDSLGRKQWSKAIGGSNDEKAAKAISIPGGGYYIFGATRSDDFDCSGNHGGAGADAYLAKLDDTGHIIWHRDLGGTGDDGGGGQNSGYACANGNGGIILATISGSNDGDVTHQINSSGYNIWLVDVDSNSNIVWNNCYGGSGQEYPTSVCTATDGSIWVAGQSYTKDGEVDTSYGGPSDAWIVHADDTGKFINAKVLGSNGQDAGLMIYPLSNGNVISGGYYEYGNGSFNISWGGGDAFLAIFSPLSTGIEQVLLNENVKIYPNPTNSFVTIAVTNNCNIVITDMVGQIVYKSTINNQLQLNVEGWKSGFYFVQVNSENGYREVQKLIVQ